MTRKYYLISFLAFLVSSLFAVRYFYPKIYTDEYQVPAPSPVPTQALTPTPIPIIGEEVFVQEVIDGDTIVLVDGRQVRYIGIDAPDLFDSSLFGRYASASAQKNTELVEGKKVRLVKDVSEIDDSDHLLRYVYVDDVFVNLELIKNGYAKLMLIPPDTAQKQELSEAQDEAYKNKLGIWQDL
jgi:endonuclease YncB( thermonuclease family)